MHIAFISENLFKYRYISVQKFSHNEFSDYKITPARKIYTHQIDFHNLVYSAVLKTVQSIIFD